MSCKKHENMNALSEAQRLLVLVINELASRGNSENACAVYLSMLSYACESYLNTTRGLIASLEKGNRFESFVPEYSGAEVQSMFCTVINHFSNDLVRVFHLFETKPFRSLFSIGDDSVDYILDYLSTNEIVKVSQVCRKFKQLSSKFKVQNFTISLGRNDKDIRYLSGDGDQIVWSNDSFDFDFGDVQKIKMDVCCEAHIQQIFATGLKAKRAKGIEFSIGRQWHSRPSSCFDAIGNFLTCSMNTIEVLKLTLHEYSFFHLNSLKGCLSTLNQMKALEILVVTECPDTYQRLDFSFLGEEFPAVESIEISCLSNFCIDGLVAFPWERCKTIHLSSITITAEDWKIISERFDNCESLQLELFCLEEDIQISVSEFFSYPFISQLKKLYIDNDNEWITDSELDRMPDRILTSLEWLQIDSLHPKAMASIAQYAPNLSDVTFVFKGDLLEWKSSALRERHIVDMLLNSFPVPVQIKVLKFGLNHEDSSLEVTPFERDDFIFKDRLEFASKIQKTFPRIERFAFFPPDKGHYCVDFKPFLYLLKSRLCSG
jgi:hypothetical protein